MTPARPPEQHSHVTFTSLLTFSRQLSPRLDGVHYPITAALTTIGFRTTGLKWSSNGAKWPLEYKADKQLVKTNVLSATLIKLLSIDDKTITTQRCYDLYKMVDLFSCFSSLKSHFVLHVLRSSQCFCYSFPISLSLFLRICLLVLFLCFSVHGYSASFSSLGLRRLTFSYF